MKFLIAALMMFATSALASPASNLDKLVREELRTAGVTQPVAISLAYVVADACFVGMNGNVKNELEKEFAIANCTAAFVLAGKAQQEENIISKYGVKSCERYAWLVGQVVTYQISPEELMAEKFPAKVRDNAVRLSEMVQNISKAAQLRTLTVCGQHRQSKGL